MSLSISNLPTGIASLPVPPSPNAGGAAPTGATSFKDYLLNSLDQVNSMQQEANKAIETMAVGGDVNPAEVLTAVQKADLAFRLTMQMRNKLMEVYQEIKDMRI